MKYYESKGNFSGKTRFMAKKTDFFKTFIPTIILPIAFFIYHTGVGADGDPDYAKWFKGLLIGNLVFAAVYTIAWIKFRNDNKYFARGFLTSGIICLIPVIAILIAILFMFY